MKTPKKPSPFGLHFLFLFFALTIVSCGRDSGISLGDTSVSHDSINDCSTSKGSVTKFAFHTAYTAEEGQAVKTILVNIKDSEGTSEDGQTSVFFDDGSELFWGVCFRFAEANWVEFSIQLQTEEGSKSKKKTFRVNKPEGAN